MNKEKLQELSKLITDTITKFDKEHNLRIQKITFENNILTFEYWSVGDDDKIKIQNYSYYYQNKS